MSGSHTREHSAVLQRVLTDELDRESEEVRRLIASCPICRTELEALRGVARDLARVGAEDRDQLERAIADQSDEDRERMSRLVARAGRPRARGPGRWAWIATLAATLLLSIVLWKITAVPGADEPQFMGDSDPECISPIGVVDAIGAFRWNWPREAGESYVLELFRGDEPEPFRVVRGLREAGWQPEEGVLDELRVIRYEIRRVDASGATVGYIRGSAKVRP